MLLFHWKLLLLPPDDDPVQHRETQGHESPLFKSYFPSITIRKGGAKSGFRHVEEAKAEPKLYHFSNDGKTVKVKFWRINFVVYVGFVIQNSAGILEIEFWVNI